jgi:hypothetical protein
MTEDGEETVGRQGLRIDIAQAASFLQVLFAGNAPAWRIEFRAIQRASRAVERRFYGSGDSILWKEFEARNRTGSDIYVGVCPRKGQGSTKAWVAAVPALWADLDGKDFPGGKAEALRQLSALLPAHLYPSLIVDSGHGVHPYWLLREPELITHADDHLRLERYTRGLAHHLGGDHTHDLSRIMRLPGTWNLKQPQTPRLATLLHAEPERRFNLSDFEEYGAAPALREAATVRFSGAPAAIDLSRFQLSPKMVRLIEDGWDHRSGYHSRSEADHAVVGALVHAGASDDDVLAVFAEPRWHIGEKFRAKGASGRAYLAISIRKWRARQPAEAAHPGGERQPTGTTVYHEEGYHGGRRWQRIVYTRRVRAALGGRPSYLAGEKLRAQAGGD